MGPETADGPAATRQTSEPAEQPAATEESEVQVLRKQVETLQKEMAELRLQSHNQVASLVYEVQWLRAHLGGIGNAIREELSSIVAAPAPQPLSMPGWAAAAAAWQAAAQQQQAAQFTSQPLMSANSTAAMDAEKTKEAKEALNAMQAQFTAGGTGSTACVEVPSSLSPTPSETNLSQASTHATPNTVAPQNESGRELMTLLTRNAKKVPASATKSTSEPLPMSLDEFCVWQMQTREDAEGGADDRNAETFGDDAHSYWTFEENLAANRRLAAGSKKQAATNWQSWRSAGYESKVRTSTDLTESTGVSMEGETMSTSSHSDGSNAGAAANLESISAGKGNQEGASNRRSRRRAGSGAPAAAGLLMQ
mmetsp:Transcript_42055/g.75541  ORF Transcript_42055/g.75541 Transcript_42055/m.75541 type:complete len:366 (+) Transcript_42055:43-1140(+)